MSNKKKIALVLGGGSALGYAHIGVLRAMIEKGIRPDLIIGTSMGAIVGAYYSLFDEIDGMEKVLDNTSSIKMATDPGFFSLGIIKGTKLENKFKEVFGEKTFSNCKTKLRINACDINTGKNYFFRNGMLRDAVRASISLPGILPPLVKDDMILIDGGVANNLAIDYVPKDYRIISVKVTPNNDKHIISKEDLETKNPIKRVKLYFDLLNKSISIMTNNLEEHLLETRDILHITPNLDQFSYISFPKYKDIISTGYYEANKVLKNFKV